jgi:hypothetical protein
MYTKPVIFEILVYQMFTSLKKNHQSNKMVHLGHIFNEKKKKKIFKHLSMAYRKNLHGTIPIFPIVKN